MTHRHCALARRRPARSITTAAGAVTTPVLGRAALVLPLGALAAGFGLSGAALAQDGEPAAVEVAASAPAPAPVPSPAELVAPPAPGESALPRITVRSRTELPAKETLQATRSGIGKGDQALRDIPQSVTVVTERLIDDRNLDTLKEALKNTAGISFQAAEGGEEDIRLRGFSLQATGDIFIDGIRDPAFYDRDSFNWDRLEVLRGSASMLFGRGSTGGAVNQVSKQPMLMNQNEVAVTLGSGNFLRATADFNRKTGDDAALRITAMANTADDGGLGTKIKKTGLAGAYRWGIGTADEFQVGLYHLDNDNGVNYGMPWIQPSAGATERTLLPVKPNAYYGMASDYSAGGADTGTLGHVHRFVGGAELKTSLRVAHYERDLRASAIRLCTRTVNATTGAVTNPECPTTTPTVQTLIDATLLTRGTNIKIQSMDTQYVQSDYSGKFGWFGLQHAVLSGVDLAHEQFSNQALDPASPTLTKAKTTIGTPDDGASVNEASRITRTTREFDAKALGVYFQDLVQVAPDWKVLGGLRWDRFEGKYGTPDLAQANGTVTAATHLERTDSLWSKRFGVLYQPTPLASFHFSYGTSFNTSGDTYQYDVGTVKADPEASRNIELGAKLDSEDGKFTARVALFHSTKYNERNRDDTSVNATNYVLSGRRHAAGLELDLAGRITPAWEVFSSLAYIPDAKVDAGSPQALQQNGEVIGARPGLTPRYTATVWSTWKLTQQWRLGGGLNARSTDKPIGLASNVTIDAPAFVTADLMAEYEQGDMSWKLNVSNVTNKLYADMLYRGHYIAGKARQVQLTAAYKF